MKEELAVAVLVASKRCAFSEWKGRARSCSEMPTPPCSKHLGISKQPAILREAGVSVTLQTLCALSAGLGLRIRRSALTGVGVGTQKHSARVGAHLPAGGRPC